MIRTKFRNAKFIYNSSISKLSTTAYLKSSDENYRRLLAESTLDNTSFWKSQALSRLNFIKPFSITNKIDFNSAKFEWFSDGQINVKENCVDRHVTAFPDKTALIHEPDEPGTHEKISYKQLQTLVHKIAYKLVNIGVKKGDKVAIYMPTNPQSVAAMLACAQIGAVHNVVFAGFSSKALAERIDDSGAKVLLTSEVMVRGGKVIDIYEKIVKDAVDKSSCLQNVLIQGNLPKTKSKNSKVTFNLLEDGSNLEHTKNEALSSEDELFILYTSGSTGKPKGLVHTSAGYLLYAGITHEHIFEYEPNDIYACVADIGWITGHSYVVYGPLANGATTVLFSTTPTYPDAGRYWEMIQRLKINQFYTSPTAIRLLYGQDKSYYEKYDLSSLKVLATVGEPIGTEPWKWYYENIGKSRCPIADTYWQSETGGVVLTPTPVLTASGRQEPGYAGHGFLGQKPFVDPNNDYLYLRQAWPGMARTILNDHDRFKSTYYSNPEIGYFTGDLAEFNEEKGFLVKGRADDVINISGKRLGTAEIESVLNQHYNISESAVISIPDNIKGEVPIAFVTNIKRENGNENTNSDDFKNLRIELKDLVKSEIAGFAVPGRFYFTDNLPKTRSGKIMRRILKKLAEGEEDLLKLGDLSTLADSESVGRLIKDMEN